MQLLQDVFIIENLQVLEEGKKNGVMKIRGTFQRAMEANNNGRIYPTAVLEGQISKLQPLITERRLCGELDHPQNETVRLSNASHLVTKLEMRGNEVIGEAEVLRTPAGLTAQALINGGVKIGISSRGMGTLSEDHTGNKVVNEDFRLVTFDLVADPSTRGAYPGLAESTESKFAREVQSKLQKESNFVTMLESKMRKAYKPWVEEAKKLKPEVEKESTPELKVETSPAFELVKADGHWHRIAEVIKARMNEVYAPRGGEKPVGGKPVAPFTRLHGKVVSGARRVRGMLRRSAAIRRRTTAKATATERHKEKVKLQRQQLVARQDANPQGTVDRDVFDVAREREEAEKAEDAPVSTSDETLKGDDTPSKRDIVLGRLKDAIRRVRKRKNGNEAEGEETVEVEAEVEDGT